MDFELYDVLGIICVLIIVFNYNKIDKYSIIVLITCGLFIQGMSVEFGSIGKKISSIIVIVALAILYFIKQRADNNIEPN